MKRKGVTDFGKGDPLAVQVDNKFMAEQKLDYIHLNPFQFQWNLAERPENYPFSSAGYYENEGNDLDYKRITQRGLNSCLWSVRTQTTGEGYRYSSARFYENEDAEFDFLTHYMKCVAIK